MQSGGQGGGSGGGGREDMPQGIGESGAHGAMHSSRAIEVQETLKKMKSLRWNISDFRLVEVLGTGRASTVYRAVHVSVGVEFAIKKCNAEQMTLGASEIQRLKQEISVHSNVFHPAIATLYGWFSDQDGNLYLILEYAKKGDLFNLLYSPRRGIFDVCFSEADICKRIMGPLLSAVAYLHNKDIVHRDIKAENILLRGDGCKLADFGFATDLNKHRAISR